jgi:hypothetical protein
MRIRRRDFEQVLLAAERSIALVERCRPSNAESETQRLLSAWQRGDELAPEFTYATPPDLSALSQRLAEVAEHARSEDPWDTLYAERAVELSTEATLVAHIGTRALAEHAQQRFSLGDTDNRREAERWARQWSALSGADATEARIQSDDPSEPESLLCQMQRRVGEERLAFRVLVRDLMPGAATGDGAILVKRGGWYTARDGRRIVIHEVEGHALPRARAGREALGLFRLGTRGGLDDEEGRALLCEERAGVLDGERKRELGFRHLAALAVRDGADWVESVRMLLDLGAALPLAITIASRVHRGGGLAREIVYLPAFSRIRRGLAENPELERWLERGRVSLWAAAILSELGEPPDSIGTPRAA